MECACIDIDIDCVDQSELLTDCIFKAKKEHVCHECERTIKKGEQYKKETYKFEGQFECYKTCVDCLSLRDNFFCSFYYGRIWDDIEQELHQSGGIFNESCLSWLTPKSREKVCEIIEKTWKTLE